MVIVEAGGKKQMQTLLSQSSFISQNDFRLHFGLGEFSRTDTIRVDWPSGRTQTVSGGAADRYITIRESSP